jgi:O-methyltransferase
MKMRNLSGRLAVIGVGWINGLTILSPVRNALWSVLTYVLAKKHMTIQPANNEAERAPVFELIRQVRMETQMILLDQEAYNIHMGVRQTGKIPGDIAEVGVYRGGSAKLIAEAKGERPLHLFDTFEGMPDTAAVDPLFQRGQFPSSSEEVKKYLVSYPSVSLYKGYFPDTAGPVEDKRFSFVHLDVDIYESTAKSLAFFYPRMARGALLISHDYMWAEGVKRAFDEFFADKPEAVIELGGSQCAFIKLG